MPVTVDGSVATSVLAALLTFLIYVVTLANDLTWQNYGGDGGELITASMTLGIPHPPGYPLYVILGRLFAYLPLGNLAARYSLFSAVAVSIAVGLVVLSLSMRNRVGAVNSSARLAIGLALATTPLIWSQAIIVEVYGLFLALLAFFIWTIMSGQPAWIVGLALGLSLSGHLSALLLAPLALWRVGASGLGRFALGLLLGLSPFLLLPWLATTNSPVQWGDPRSLLGWWWLVTARLYQPNIFALPVDRWLARFNEWLSPGIMIPLSVWFGLTIASTRNAWRKRQWEPAVFLLTAGTFFVYAFANRTDDAAVQLLPAFVLLAVAGGSWLVRHRSIAIWLLPLVMLLLASAATIAGREVDLRAMATEELKHIPPGAIVMTPGDQSVAALWYFHHAEGLRQDIVIVDENMFQFDWYRTRLAKYYPGLSVPQADDLESFVDTNSGTRAVCRLTLGEAARSQCILPKREVSFE